MARVEWISLHLAFALLAGCGSEAVDETGTDSTSDTTTQTQTPTTSSTATQTTTFTTTTPTYTSVTLGVYTLDDQGNYVNDPAQDLTLQIGVACDSWSRTTRKPDAFCPTEPNCPHDHFNAADDSSYDGVTFFWTEYGPQHSQNDIDTFCADGLEGKLKEATATDYVEEPPGSGAFLKIKSVQ